VSIFPFVDGMMDFQIIAETDSTKPVSQHRMNQLFKALMLEVLEVGFPEDVMAEIKQLKEELFATDENTRWHLVWK
jgi:hypothetical protein